MMTVPAAVPFVLMEKADGLAALITGAEAFNRPQVPTIEPVGVDRMGGEM